MSTYEEHERQAGYSLRLAGADLPASLLIQEAQVHATLALAAAVAGNRSETVIYVNAPEGMDVEELAREVARRTAEAP